MARRFEGYFALLYDKLAFTKFSLTRLQCILEPKVFPHIFPLIQAMVSKASVSVFLGEVSNLAFFLKHYAIGMF